MGLLQVLKYHQRQNKFLFEAGNETVYQGEGGERTVYLLPGEPLTLICQGERDVLWTKDGQVSKLFSSSKVIFFPVLSCMPSPGSEIF